VSQCFNKGFGKTFHFSLIPLIHFVITRSHLYLWLRLSFDFPFGTLVLRGLDLSRKIQGAFKSGGEQVIWAD
jgi:hypothetical protein